MPYYSVCCNPLELKKHTNNCKRLRKVTSNWNNVYSKYIGKYICDICRKRIVSNSDLCKTSDDIVPIDNESDFSDSEGKTLYIL